MTRSFYLCIAFLCILQLARPDGGVPLTWPNGKYYQRIGKPSLGSVFAPVDVVSYLSKSFDGAPPSWDVQRYREGMGPFHDIAIVVDKKENPFVFEITDDGWMLLNKGGGQTAISKIMEDNFRLPPSKNVKVPNLHDTQAWLKYFQSISPLYDGYPFPIVLSDQFGRAADLSNYASYTPPLKDLCKDPLFSNNENTYTVSMNVMTGKGGIEHWSITFLKDSLKIYSLNVTVLYPPHSFALPPG